MIVAVARRHRLRRTGAAAHPGAVRQTCRRATAIRRPEHLYPAQGQPGRRHPAHLRQCGALSAAAAVVRRALGDSFRNWIDNHLSQPDQLLYLVLFGLFIIGFAYFHTAITFDPVKQADTIRKQGGFIPGIRPGPPDRALPAAHPQPHHLAGWSVHRRDRDRPLDHLLQDFHTTSLGGGSKAAAASRSSARRCSSWSASALETHEADRQPADDAKLRGVPEVSGRALHLVILGRQGSGKGTQCLRLVEHYGTLHVSTGDMLRAAVPKAPSLAARSRHDHESRRPRVRRHHERHRRRPAWPSPTSRSQRGAARRFPSHRRAGRGARAHRRARVGIDAAINLDVPVAVVTERMLVTGPGPTTPPRPSPAALRSTTSRPPP